MRTKGRKSTPHRIAKGKLRDILQVHLPIFSRPFGLLLGVALDLVLELVLRTADLLLLKRVEKRSSRRLQT